ncbi:uncharacterized protein [Eucyclogobius newberryi]|uniref:uncharacterized protein isoform X2 n=1 Tax=Eucyclogobius newberryi TaxID=166745 RepID=UPI003B598081
MKLLPTALAFLSLLCVGHTAPTTNCESLTQKIDIESRDLLLGKWMYVAESTTMPGTKMLTKKFVDSSFVNVMPLPDSRSVEFTQIQKSFGSCISLSSTVQVANNTMEMTKPFSASEVLLTTGCPDCLVVLGNFTLGSTYFQSLQLLSKRRMLSTAELDEFKKQAECMKLLAPAFMDPEKELCPEEQATGTIDLTAVLNTETGSKVRAYLDSIISNPDGLGGFFFGNMPRAKED